MKKNTFVAILVGCIMASLVACGSNTTTTETETTTQKQTDTTTEKQTETTKNKNGGVVTDIIDDVGTDASEIGRDIRQNME